jgi:hypothetical protein
MRLDYVVRILWLLATVVLSPVSVNLQWTSLPGVDRVEPAAARPGELVTGFGANLDRSSVVDLVLGSPDTTALARIVEQHDNLIRFRIPSSLAAGRELIDQETFIDVLEETEYSLVGAKLRAIDEPGEF